MSGTLKWLFKGMIVWKRMWMAMTTTSVVASLSTILVLAVNLGVE